MHEVCEGRPFTGHYLQLNPARDFLRLRSFGVWLRNLAEAELGASGEHGLGLAGEVHFAHRVGNHLPALHDGVLLGGEAEHRIEIDDHSSTDVGVKRAHLRLLRLIKRSEELLKFFDFSGSKRRINALRRNGDGHGGLHAGEAVHICAVGFIGRNLDGRDRLRGSGRHRRAADLDRSRHAHCRNRLRVRMRCRRKRDRRSERGQECAVAGWLENCQRVLRVHRVVYLHVLLTNHCRFRRSFPHLWLVFRHRCGPCVQAGAGRVRWLCPWANPWDAPSRRARRGSSARD